MKIIVTAFLGLFLIAPAQARCMDDFVTCVRNDAGWIAPAQTKKQRRLARELNLAPRLTSNEGWHESSLISEMRRHIGASGSIVGMARNWCGAYLDLALRRTGHPPGSKLAIAYARYGRPAAGPTPGAIVVWRGHVGAVTAVNGNTITVISGNDGRRVRERERSTRGVVAYRIPA